MARHLAIVLLVSAAGVCGFGAVPRVARRAPAYSAWARTASLEMKKTWSRRETVAETIGGADEQGAEAVGLTGTIPVQFLQGNDTIKTMAHVGQPLSAVAAQAGQHIKYQCRKGECGTCEVRVDGKWIRTCVSQVPYVEAGDTYSVFVKGSMKKAKTSARFYSVRSIFAGLKNNVMGMAGFVREGRRSQGRFKERISAEEELMAIVAAKKAAKKAAAAEAEKRR